MTTDEPRAIEFKGRHEHISPRMRDHATRKLAKLQRFNDRVTRIEVVADHIHEDPEVELIVHLRRGKPLVAKQQAGSFAAAIDELVEKMEKQLKRQKEKRKDHKGAGARAGLPKAPGRGAAAGRAGARSAGDEETYEEVVRRTLRG